MTKPALSLMAALAIALLAAPAWIPAHAAGGGAGDVSDMMSGKPTPPVSSSQAGGNSQTNGTTRRTQKLKKAKQSFLDEPAFVSGYRSAYAAIYDQHDYTRAIAQLRSLGHD